VLPADSLTEILTNLSALNLQPKTAAQILAAVLAPLLRNSGAPDLDPDLELKTRKLRGGRPRGRPRRAVRSKPRGSRPKRKYRRHVPSAARERAIAALRANPDATLAHVAKIAKCGFGTAVNARKDLAAEERKAARRKPRETMPSTPSGGAKTDRRERSQRFLKDELARGPKKVTDVEDAAARAHVDPQTLDQARADLGIVTSRSNAGGVQAVQWSLPG